MDRAQLNAYCKKKRSVTLLELLLSLIILGIVVLTFASIDVFCRHQVLSSDKRVQAQNNASKVLEHMNKKIGAAIGNEKITGMGPVITIFASTNTVIAFVDANLSGIRGDTVGPGPDLWVGYRLDGNNLRFCGNANGSTGDCVETAGGWNNAEVISDEVTVFTVVKPVAGLYLNQNYIDVTVTTCANPNNLPYACNTPSNPIAEMKTRILMPSVSLN